MRLQKVSEERAEEYEKHLEEMLQSRYPDLLPEFRPLVESYSEDKYILHHVLCFLLDSHYNSKKQGIKEGISLMSKFESRPMLGMYVARNAHSITHYGKSFRKQMSRFYGSSGLSELLGGRDEEQVAGILGKFTSMAKETEKPELLHDIVQLLLQSDEKSMVGLMDAVIGFCTEIGTRRLTRELIQRCKDGQKIADQSWYLAYTCEPVIYNHSSRIVRDLHHLFADLITIPGMMKRRIKGYWKCCDILVGYEPFVYEELAINVARSTDILKTIKKEREFLKQQTSGNVIPLAVILTEIGKSYRQQIKDLDNKTDLVRAYSIAKDNTDEDTNKNYLPEFYDGLREGLDENPDHVERWAAYICSEFRKKGEEGLERWVG